MLFELLPILETMLKFYQQPKTFDRFQDYIKILQGDKKGDLVIPIGGFNPMAKEHVLEKLIELRGLNIEIIINETLKKLNAEIKDKNHPIIKVAFNLSDDLKGAWTNRFIADYDSKFKMKALIARNFCTPIFWTSENYSTDIIIERTLEYCYRTIYWSLSPNPKTLAEHILQETAVAKKCGNDFEKGIDFKLLNQFYESNKNSADYSIIFNFLYGDDAMIVLGNNPLGIKEPFAGFEFARWLGNDQIIK